MALRIYPATTPYDEVYQKLVSNVLAGSQWLRAPLVLPYKMEASSFIVEATIGDVIEVYLNNKLYIVVTSAFNKNQLNIQLEQGYNYIYIKTTTENYLILVAATYWAIYLDSWAREFYYSTGVKLEDANRQLSNFFSLRAVEHQLEFQDLLPPTRAERILAGKIATKALINETGTTRGVNEIVTAAANATPLVIPTQVNTSYLDPGYDLYTTAQDFGGYEFNCWMPNICTTVWSTFLSLLKNLPTVEIVSATDRKVTIIIGKTNAQITSSGLLNPTLFSGGETLDLVIDNVSFTTLFKSTDQTPANICERINIYSKRARLQYTVAWVVGNEIRIASGKKGSLSNVRVTGGTSLAKLGFTLSSADIGKDGVTETHVFDAEKDGCNIINTIFNSCFSKIRVWVSSTLTGDIAFCMWQYPIEIVVELPLGSGRLDSGRIFDSGVFDSGDPADPYGDGFAGSVITPPLDSGLHFDDFFRVTLPEDVDCAFNSGAVVTELAAVLMETSIDIDTPRVESTLAITTDSPTTLYFATEASYSNSSYKYVMYHNAVYAALTGPYTGTQKPLLTAEIPRTFIQLEEARTCINRRSEQLSILLGTITYITVTENAINDPVGYLTCDKIKETADTGVHEGHYLLNFTTSLPYIFSVFAKAGERDTFSMSTESSGPGAFAAGGYGVTFDLTAETYAVMSGYNTPDWIMMVPLNAGYYYCAFCATTIATASSYTYLWLGDGTSYAGVLDNGLYLWGVNTVQSVFYTSYIQNNTDSPRTRNKDQFYYYSSTAPAWLREQFTVEIIPNYSNAQLALSGVVKYIAHYPGSTESFAIFIDTAGKINIVGSISGLLLQTSALTWNFRQRLKITVIANSVGVSKIITSGFTSGDGTYTGTAYSIPSGGAYWGMDTAKNFQICGFISEARR